jgi:hypothetical protein
MSEARAALALVVLLVGLAGLAFAHDLRAWNEALDRGDARFGVAPATARWHADTWLPGRISRQALALDDDLALRRGEQAYAVARATPRGLDNGARQARVRATAELALADAVAVGSHEQSSRAGNLLGVLVATGDEGADASVGERRAGELFEAAVRADAENTDAKYNLELLLRRIRVVGTREGTGSGSGDRGASRRGAGSGTAGSGY